jgi:hypothetical protein
VSLAAKWRAQVIDDPGGNKARLEHAFKRNVWLSPEDIRTIMLRRTKRVYDVELYGHALALNMQHETNTHTHMRIHKSTIAPEKDTLAYMTKLKHICDALQKWGVAHIVKDALESLDGPVLHAIDIDLCIGTRLAEFELD